MRTNRACQSGIQLHCHCYPALLAVGLHASQATLCSGWSARSRCQVDFKTRRGCSKYIISVQCPPGTLLQSFEQLHGQILEDLVVWFMQENER